MKARPVAIVVLSKYKEVFDEFWRRYTDHLKPGDSVTTNVLVIDGAADWSFPEDAGWKVLRGSEKFSMAGNGNLGLRAVPPDHDVLYCGDDIRFLEPNTVERLQEVAYLNKSIGVLSPRLLGRSSPALANPPQNQSFTYVRPLEFWYPCVYIKREVLDKVGYLDEQFSGFGSDDLDYNIRVQQAGYKLAVTPRVTVQHESSPEGGPTTFVKSIGVEEWQRQQAAAFSKLQSKLGVDAQTFALFLETNDMRLLDPSAAPTGPTGASSDPVPIRVQPKSLADTNFEGQGKRGLSGKSLFIMTPMYGGQCTMNFVISFINLIGVCRQFGVQMSYMFLHNESLITRARNRMIDYWMKKSDATHGVFIDADIGFDPNDLLVALDLDLDIAGFPCVKKSIRWDRVQDLVKKFNTNGHASAGRTFTPEELSQVAGDFILNFDAFNGRKTFNLGEPQLAHSVGTGIMMISRRVIQGLQDNYYPDNWYIGSHTDAAALEGKIFDHFQVGVNPESKDYDSEDYRFCINARKAGYKVWVLPWTKTTHAGTYVFSGDLPTMSALMPEWAR